jgi:hypothetical protein
VHIVIGGKESANGLAITTKTTVALGWKIIFMMSIALFTTASSAFGRPVEPRGRKEAISDDRVPFC